MSNLLTLVRQYTAAVLAAVLLLSIAPIALPAGQAQDAASGSIPNVMTKYRSWQWRSSTIPSVPGRKYTLQETFSSVSPTKVWVRYNLTGGKTLNAVIAMPPKTSGMQGFNFQFTTPANTVSLMIFHETTTVATMDVQSSELRWGNASPTPTVTPTKTPTPTPTATPTTTPTKTPTPTPTATPTPTPTAAPSPSPTPSPSPSPSASPSATPQPTAGANLIKNASLETAGTNGDPADWSRGGWGNNTAVFTYPAEAQSGNTGAKVEITAYTDGDAKWYFEDVPVSEGKTYSFSDYYQSTVSSQLNIRYTFTDGHQEYIAVGSVLSPTSTWKQVQAEAIVPAGAISLTVFHLIDGIGSLTIDNASLTKKSDSLPPSDKFPNGLISFTFDDGWNSHYTEAFTRLNEAGFKGSFYIITNDMQSADPAMTNLNPTDYMNAQMIQAMHAAGHEISSHSKSHPSLPSLTATQQTNEIKGSRTVLTNLGIAPVNTFVYPMGEYNDSVVAQVKDAGYTGARTVDRGYNTKSTNKYLLKEQEIDGSVVFSDVKGWIDTAKTQKTWLVLTFHQIDHTGAFYGNTPELLQQIIDYVKASELEVVTLKDGITRMDE